MHIDINFEEIGKLWNQAEKLGMISYIVKIWDLLFHPRKFWQEYCNLTRKEKTVQFGTYGILYALAIWLASFDNPTPVELAKLVPIQATLVVYYIIVVFLANVVVSRKKGGFGFSVVLCCYIKFIFSIPQLLAIKAYYDTEYPLALAIAVIIPLIAELLCLGYAAVVWQRGQKRIIGAFVLSIVMMNFVDFVISLTGWEREYNEFSDNRIVEERNDLLKSLNGVYDMPLFVCYGDSGVADSYVVRDYYEPMGEAVEVEADKYNARVKEDMDSLRVMVRNCQFKTNREFFNELYTQKKHILNTNEASKKKDMSFMTGGRVWDLETMELRGKAYRKYEEMLKEGNFSLIRHAAGIMQKHHEAYSYSRIGFIWHPYLYYYDNNKYRIAHTLPGDSNFAL